VSNRIELLPDFFSVFFGAVTRIAVQAKLSKVARNYFDKARGPPLRQRFAKCTKQSRESADGTLKDAANNRIAIEGAT
jgi:hypothetical protein